jgi:hypothetical protein
MSKFFKSFWDSLDDGILTALAAVSLLIAACIGLLTRSQDNWLVATITSLGAIYLGGLVMLFLSFLLKKAFENTEFLPSQASGREEQAQDDLEPTEPELKRERMRTNARSFSPGSFGSLSTSLRHPAHAGVRLSQK